MNSILASKGLSEHLESFNPKLCASNIADLGEHGPALCSAYAEGLRWSMSATVVVFLIAAVCFFLAARSYRRDAYAPVSPANELS